MGKFSPIIGAKFETAVCKYLEHKGYEIIKRNWRCYCGEIDIVCEDRLDLVFVEVKFRSSLIYGLPEEYFNSKKKNSLIKSVGVYLSDNVPVNKYYRIDLISIYPTNRNYRLSHYKGIST